MVGISCRGSQVGDSPVGGSLGVVGVGGLAQ